MMVRMAAPMLALALLACTKSKDPPAANKQDGPLPYRSASASEVFNLRTQCAKLGDEILEGEIVGPALTKDIATHYNPKTNRCYAQVTIQPSDLSGGDSSTYLYDGQTKEMLAFYTNKAGKKTYMNLAQLPTGDEEETNVPNEEQVLDAINLAMRDDRKN
jgi:hypothetical protein